ncbi:MAG: PAS domain S-box protein, partial [Myxococcota bacterium]
METPAAPRPTDPSSVVLILSTDESLVDELAVDLNEREPDVEIQVVENIETLADHLTRLRPDAVLLDTESLPEDMADGDMGGHGLDQAPVVLLSADIERWKRLKTRLNARDHIPRRADYVFAVAEALRVAQRTAGYEGRIQETVQHYRDILEASSDGIFVLVGGTFTFVNENFATTLGRAPETLVALHGLIDVALPDDRHVLQEELARVAVADGRRELIETRLLDAKGEAHTFEIACRSSVVEGRRAIVGVARDVTAERQLEDEIERARQRAAQIERLRALGELAAGVAHDFNNVLETVLGRLALAREKLKNGEPIQDDLEVIETAARDGAATVQRV